MRGVTSCEHELNFNAFHPFSRYLLRGGEKSCHEVPFLAYTIFVCALLRNVFLAVHTRELVSCFIHTPLSELFNFCS